jgi:hypothetical protein
MPLCLHTCKHSCSCLLEYTASAEAPSKKNPCQSHLQLQCDFPPTKANILEPVPAVALGREHVTQARIGGYIRSMFCTRFMLKSVCRLHVVVSKIIVCRIAIRASERAVYGSWYLNGSQFRKRWYQQLWYAIDMLVPVRYSSFLFDNLWCKQRVSNVVCLLIPRLQFQQRITCSVFHLSIKKVGMDIRFDLRVRVGVTSSCRMFAFDRQIEIQGYVFE